jgi:MFS family permease
LAGKLYTEFSSKVGPRPAVGKCANLRKYTFLAFLGVFEIGSVLCGAAQSSDMLIIGRAVAGLGGSGLSNGALTILGAAVPMQKRPGEFLYNQ